MIELTKGNLLKAPAEALVNTVNTAGVMGKGIALQFKQAYPAMFREYERACKAGEVKLGHVSVFDLGALAGGPRWIINFPTKAHWRATSKLSDIEHGLVDLAHTIKDLKIRSIAVPPLGCGNGGLYWGDVRPCIVNALSDLGDVRVLLYEPDGAPRAEQMPNRTERPKMTIGRAALIGLMDRYLKGFLDPIVTLLEIHKLMYFLQEANEPLKLKFHQGKFGPYASNLRQVLIRLEQHYTSGYGDGADDPDKPMELLPGAVDEAQAMLQKSGDTLARIERVVALIEGYEDPYGMELLSSVHWMMKNRPETRDDCTLAVKAVHDWNARKRKSLKAEHISTAWRHLKEQGWDKFH